MKPELITAYRCPLCATIKSSQSDSAKCLETCFKKIQKTEAEEKKRIEFEIKKNYIRLNVESFHEVGTLLEQRAEELGFKLKITISGHVKDILTTHDSPIGIKRFHWNDWQLPESERKEIIKNNTYPAFIGSVKGAISGIYFSDFIRNYFTGIHTGSGGGGSSNFSYEIKMYVNDFPKIKVGYDEYLILEKINQERHVKLKELQESYKEYLKWKTFADPIWAVHNQELKELNLRVEEVKDIINNRAKELDNERAERILLDDNFDSDKYNILKYNFIL